MKKPALFFCLLWLAGAAGAEDKAVPVQKYTYSADRFSDPFVPYKAGETSSLPQEFDPAGAQVGGLISTSSGKIAVLRTLTEGAFIVKGGRLIDAAGRTVAGFYSRITPSSVVVWTANGTRRYAYPLKTGREGDSR